jgi:hypothetical protein
MQLKQRIKRIESKVKINHSPFCACEDAYEKDGVQTIQNSIPEFCKRCRKPIEKQRIIVCFA